MCTCKQKSKKPAGTPGNFNYVFTCTKDDGTKTEIKVTSGNDNEAKQLAELECSEVKNANMPWFLEALQEDLLSRLSLVPINQFHQVETPDFKIKILSRLPYDVSAAFAYAKKYCGQKTNSCGKFYEADCAHFMSHCLAAGGVTVKGSSPGASCPHGLCIRAEELAAAFYNATKQYDNVKQLNSFSDGQKGDYGFLRRFIEKSHAFLLDGRPSADTAPAYAHTSPHCGDNMESFRILFGAYYRIQ